MRGAMLLAYGALCYVAFFLTFLYAIAFVGDFAVARTIDHGPETATTVAVVVDLILLGLFAVQHSGMARPGFKRWFTRWVPRSIERSTYVLLSSALLVLLFWQWRPLPTMVWNAGAPWAEWLLYSLCAIGWIIVLTSTFVIDHWDLFGLRQVWFRARRQQYSPPEFKDNFYYRIVRHPLMLGFIIAFWATPRMSAGHLLFAIATTGYILIAVQLEERDLATFHGESYAEYKRKVPMLCPWPRP